MHRKRLFKIGQNKSIFLSDKSGQEQIMVKCGKTLTPVCPNGFLKKGEKVGFISLSQSG